MQPYHRPTTDMTLQLLTCLEQVRPREVHIRPVQISAPGVTLSSWLALTRRHWPRQDN